MYSAQPATATGSAEHAGPSVSGFAVRSTACTPAPAWTAYAGAVVARIKVGSTPNDGDVLGGAVWFPDKGGTLYRISRNGNHVTGPLALHAGDPFTLVGYARRLWIADFAGTDVLVVNPARLP